MLLGKRQDRVTNCLFYALGKWRAHGGYLIARRSIHYPIPHFMWAPSIEGLEVYEFKPLAPEKILATHVPWLWMVMFRGRVRRGIGEEVQRTGSRRRRRWGDRFREQHRVHKRFARI